MLPTAQEKLRCNEAERVVLLDNFSRRWSREMSAEYENRLIRVRFAELPARLLCQGPVGVEIVVPFGIAALNWMMHQVAGYDRVLPLRRDSNGKVAWRVTGS